MKLKTLNFDCGTLKQEPVAPRREVSAFEDSFNEEAQSLVEAPRVSKIAMKKA